MMPWGGISADGGYRQEWLPRYIPDEHSAIIRLLVLCTVESALTNPTGVVPCTEQTTTISMVFLQI